MQQINLYHAQLRKPDVLLSSSHLIQGSIALIVLLGLIQFYNQYQHYSSKTKIQKLNTQLSSKNTLLTTFQNSLPKVKKDLNLKDKLTQLEVDLVNKQTVLNVLSEKKLGNTEGFSKQFVGLARQTIKDLWLTKIHFLQGGTVLDIEGKAKQPTLVPQYLQALSSETIFNGTEFNSFIINRNENNTTLKFRLSNTSKMTNKQARLTSR